MKKNLPLYVGVFAILFSTSCSGPKAYTSTLFERQTANHKVIAVLPAEMIFTGTQPRNITPEQIDELNLIESKMFQNSLYNSIFRYANTRKYFLNINIQDITTTINLLEENHISIRDSWKEDDKKLARILGVDAVVRLRIQKQRYMSDLASMGIDVGKRVLYSIGAATKVPMPYISSKTNDVTASCNIVCNSQTLWNDSYKAAADYNHPVETVVDNITDNFGRNFPYKKRN